MTSPKLSVTASAGPRLRDGGPDFGPYLSETRCPSCSERIGLDEPISFSRGDWFHALCLRTDLADAATREAWLTLGSQLARRPQDFTRSQTRLIVDRLLQIAAGMVPERWDGVAS